MRRMLKFTKGMEISFVSDLIPLEDNVDFHSFQVEDLIILPYGYFNLFGSFLVDHSFANHLVVEVHSYIISILNLAILSHLDPVFLRVVCFAQCYYDFAIKAFFGICDHHV